MHIFFNDSKTFQTKCCLFKATLFNDALVQSQFYVGDRPLALPKLNLQFLTIHDYLLRNFTLFRLESSYEIRQDIEDAVKRLSPRLTFPDRKTDFAGWARMAIPVEGVSVVDVGQAQLGQDRPSHVKADITFDIGRYADTIRKEWDSLRRHDVLFLLTIEAKEETSERYTGRVDFKTHYGIKYVRGCELEDILGSDGRPLDETRKPTVEDSREKLIGTRRTLRVLLDPNQYKKDMENFHTRKSEDVHETFNVLVRRKPQVCLFISTGGMIIPVFEDINDILYRRITLRPFSKRFEI